MKILICHNKYQGVGGEDAVARAEAELLRGHGHDVIEYVRHNDEIKEYGPLDKARLYFSTTWSDESFRRIKDLCREHRPDIAHFHNILPLISPSAYYACSEEGVPVVQSLHNHRLICPGGLLMRGGEICEECVGAGFRPALKNKCYRDSYIVTRAVVRMLERHRKMGTYDHKIDKYIAGSTESLRLKYIEGGLPAEKIVVKPNFLSSYPEPQYGGDYAIFVGRFSKEKGLSVLLDAWRQIDKFPLVVVGDGPSRGKMEAAAGPNIEFIGQVSTEKLLEVLSGARFLVFPSIWYEAFPITLLLAFACGKPVVASRLGAMADVVGDEATGLLFEPSNADDLATKAGRLIDDPGLSEELGRAARAEFDAKYTPEKNYGLMMDIYNSLIKE